MLASAHRDVVLDGRMTFLLFQRRPAENHALIHQHVVSNLSRVPHGHAHVVIDEEPPSYQGSGVDFDPCQEPSDVRKQPAEQTEPVCPQPAGYSMKPNCLKTRIAWKHLDDVPCSRILCENGTDIFPDSLPSKPKLLLLLLPLRLRL